MRYPQTNVVRNKTSGLFHSRKASEWGDMIYPTLCPQCQSQIHNWLICLETNCKRSHFSSPGVLNIGSQRGGLKRNGFPPQPRNGDFRVPNVWKDYKRRILLVTWSCSVTRFCVPCVPPLFTFFLLFAGGSQCASGSCFILGIHTTTIGTWRGYHWP